MADRDFDFPWFPLYHEKFTNSPKVRMMTPEQVGVYILLLCHQWDVGPFDESPEELAMLCNRADVNAVTTVLERCFTSVEGMWLNERLQEIRNEQVDKRMAKVRAGRASARARRKSKRGKKKEQRSNGVATEDQQTPNNKEVEEEEEVEEETDTETTVVARATPAGWMHEVWQEVLGNDSHPLELTAKRRQKYEAMYEEQLDGVPDPERAWRAVLYAVTLSDHHMSKRSYQMPESILRNPERRSRWVQETVDVLANGRSPADRKWGRKEDELLEHLRAVEAA